MKNIRLDKCVGYFWYEKAPVGLSVNRATSEKASSFLFEVSKDSSDKNFSCISCKDWLTPGLVFSLASEMWEHLLQSFHYGVSIHETERLLQGLSHTYPRKR